MNPNSFNTCPHCAKRFHGASPACPFCAAPLGASGVGAGQAATAPASAAAPPFPSDVPSDVPPVRCFCVRCGRPIAPENRFCADCGTPVNMASGALGAPAPAGALGSIPPTVAWAAGGLLTIVGISAFVVYMVFGSAISALGGARPAAPASGITLGPDMHFVLMKVTGAANPVTVTYVTGNNSIQENNLTLPWQGTVQAQEGTLVQLAAENKSDQGDVTVEILKNDDPNNPVSLKSATSSGPYVVANTSVICCDTN